MQDKNFYDKDQISGNVDTLMTDMTIGTVTRRKRDADALSKIREKQASSDFEPHGKTSLISRLKSVFLHNKSVDDNSDDADKTEYMPINNANRNTPRNMPYAAPVGFDDDWAEDTVVIDDDNGFEDDATVVMDDEDPVATVVFTNDNQKFRGVIINGKTTIGSKSGKNDIVVDSKRISREHAEIVCRNREMFIKDCGSTNGTYINGSRQRLPKNVEYKLNIGDVITLADVDFYIEEAQ